LLTKWSCAWLLLKRPLKARLALGEVSRIYLGAHTPSHSFEATKHSIFEQEDRSGVEFMNSLIYSLF